MKSAVNILVFCTYIFLCATLESSAASREIRVGVYDNKPLVFMAESGPQGIYIDVLENIAKAEGWNLQYRQGTWDEVFTLLTRNEIDILPVVAYTESRLAQLDFCEQTLISNWGQIYARKNISMESIQSLEGKKIATLSQDTHGEHFKTLMSQLGISYETVLIENYPELFQALESGKADAGVVNYLAARNYAENYDLQSTPIVFNPIQIRYAVPKGDPADLLTAMDRHITNFKADKNSVYHTSMVHWFGAASSPFQLPGWIKWVFIILSGVFIVLVTGNIILRIQVKAKTKALRIELKNLELAEKEVKKSENLGRKMVANIADVIVIIDQSGINKYQSPNIKKLFGWKPQDVVNASIWDNVHPDDLEPAQRFFEKLMQTPDAAGMIECRYRCKNGSHKWIEFTGINLFHDPDIQGLLGNYHDITDRKQAEVEHEKLQVQLRQAQKMESVGRLAGGVAHDFNNMLGVILGHTEMALEETDPASPLYADLHSVHQAAERSAALTRQLLAFARKQTVTPKVIDLNETVEGMLKMLRQLIGEDIDLLWHPGINLQPVKVDPAQIDQLLANLCVNARDAIVGVGKITIETDGKTFDEDYCTNHLGSLPGEYVLLEVSDDGCGMDKKTLSQIFEPFFTTKEQGKGTGLGLASIYGMVKQNNGFISVYSEPDQGTTFKIYLPAYTMKSDGVMEKTPDLPAEHGNETILLVEDEAAILEMTTRMLERMGYAVVAATTPGEAIRLAHEYRGRIDLLMTDVVMPEMNGRELAGNLLSHYPDLKRLFMSGYTANVIAQHGVLDEGVHFIQKPFSKKDLGEKVRETLEG